LYTFNSIEWIQRKMLEIAKINAEYIFQFH